LKPTAVLQLFEAGLGLLELCFQLGAIQLTSSSFGSSISSMRLGQLLDLLATLDHVGVQLVRLLATGAELALDALQLSCIWSKAMP
jgi:hypothetical protein